MNSDSKISYAVMRRIKRVRTLRAVISLTTLSALAFLLALWGIATQVWVARVIANMPSFFDVPALVRFLTSAFLHTDFLVQSSAVIAAASLIWLGRECARAIIPVRHTYAR